MSYGPLVASQTDRVKWDEAGLVTVVAQDVHSGSIRMVAHANREALETTLRTREATFYSRSRKRLWKKGESSGNTMLVREAWTDCDGDCLIYLVDPAGPSCHTGAETCFFRPLTDVAEDAKRAEPTLARLWNIVVARRNASAQKSYTRSLLDHGLTRVAEKVREEGEELSRAITEESEDRVVSEAADVLYHLVVGLLGRSVTLRDVSEEIARRFGMSGLEEKASR